MSGGKVAASGRRRFSDSSAPPPVRRGASPACRLGRRDAPTTTLMSEGAADDREDGIFGPHRREGSDRGCKEARMTTDTTVTTMTREELAQERQRLAYEASIGTPGAAKQ